MAPNGPTRPGNASCGQYGSSHVHPSPWRAIWQPSRPHFVQKSANFSAKSGQICQLAGRRSRHIGPGRPNPLPECCRSPRVSATPANLSPWGARRGQNRQSGLEKDPKMLEFYYGTPPLGPGRPRPGWPGQARPARPGQPGQGRPGESQAKPRARVGPMFCSG